jgi:hypothetical protein
VKDDVLIAVDPHKAHHTVAVMDPVSRAAVDGGEFANPHDGYREMMSFVRPWRCRRWAVEGCHGARRSLAQRLVTDGEVVVDVPAKLAARVRVFSQGHGRKTARDDAMSIGLAALDATGIGAVCRDRSLDSLRLWCDRRDELIAARTQAVCRLHRLLAELTPGGARRQLSAAAAASILARIRPRFEVAKVRKALALSHLADIRRLDAEIKAVGVRIAELVDDSGTTLTDLYGIGPGVAGRILAEVGDIARFPSRHHFATYNGTAPSTCLPVNSCATGYPDQATGESTTPSTSWLSLRPAAAPAPGGPTTNANAWKARRPRKPAAASSVDSPM